MEAFSQFLPTLSFSKYKGQGGKVAIVGGCFEYTGAPFFAGASVLRLGGELSHIFCSKSAAVPIKSYSPEQIVHPYLPDPDTPVDQIESCVKKVLDWSPAIHSYVIGPGLGRDPITMNFAESIIKKFQTIDKPIVIDGDALFLASQKPHLVSGFKHFILTPNGGEFKRLQAALNLPETSTCEEMARTLKGVTIFSKGRVDIVSNGEITKEFNFPASARRVGGQGDITAGALGLFAAWAPNDYIAAAGAASEVVRKAAVAAFNRKKRSLITSDIIEDLCNILPDSWNKVIDTQ